jgi:hypothetical protein
MVAAEELAAWLCKTQRRDCKTTRILPYLFRIRYIDNKSLKCDIERNAQER